MLAKVIELIDKANYESKYLKFETPFSEVSSVYYFTNENIKDYFNEFDFSKVTNALTVCASGDQIFNLVHKNVKKIDVFDSNNLSEYFSLGIKSAAIKTFSYEDFLKFYDEMVDESLSVEMQYKNFLKLKDNMESKYFNFFNLIFLNSINKNHRLSVFKILTINQIDHRLVVKMNNYLESKEDYEKTKNNLKNANIKFIKSDVFDLKKTFNLSYDVIFLSNIFDYIYKKYGYFWTYEDIMPFVENDLMSMLNEDGQIVLGYLFKYYSVVRKKGRTHLFANSSVKSEDFESNIKTVPIYRLKDDAVSVSLVNDGVVIVGKSR